MTKISEVKPVKQPTATNQLMNIFAYVAIALTIFLLLLGIYALVRNREATQKETDQTTELVKEVKRLSEENKRLNATSNSYAYCNAVLVAKYTQTLKPITIEDLEKCILISFPEPETSPSTSINLTRQPVAQQPTENNQTPNQPNSPVQPNNPTPTQETPPDERVEVSVPSILGLPGIKLESCVDLLMLIKTC